MIYSSYRVSLEHCFLFLLFSLSRSFSLDSFGRGMRGPGRGHVGTPKVSANGDAVMRDSTMTEATKQNLLTRVLYCTCEESLAACCQANTLTICALTQRNQDTRGTSNSAPSCVSTPLVATIRSHHSSPPFVATRPHSKPFGAIRCQHSSPLDANRSHHRTTSSPGALGPPWRPRLSHCDFKTVTLTRDSEQLVARLSTVAQIRSTHLHCHRLWISRSTQYHPSVDVESF